MKQTQLTSKTKLLNEQGELNQRGYATSLLLEYSRDQVKAKHHRIKEWDYYFFGDDQFGVALTIADNSYMGVIGATFFDFVNQKKYDYKNILPFTKGKLKMPTDSMRGDIYYHDNKTVFTTHLGQGKRHILCKIPKFNKLGAFEFEANVTYQNENSLVIVTPFKEDPKAFYYNQKINNLIANGVVKFGDKTYQLINSQGVLDWGRGVWTRDNTWYWSSLSTILEDGSPFGFNLGYGFGDTSAASENMAFYRGKSYKLNDVEFGLPQKGFTSPWRFTSQDRAINLIFTPIYDNRTLINLLLIKQDAHQVFGHFTGTIKLDDQHTVSIKQAFGFAEEVRNVW